MTAPFRLHARILAEAPPGTFFGFHDVTPWSPDDTRLLLTRVDPHLRRRPGPSDVARILLWDPATGAAETLGETTCWNFQQGARAMWVPGRAATAVWNTRVGDAPGAEMLDLATGARRRLPHALGSLAPDGRTALAPDYARLGALWPAYGYAGFPADPDPAPADDGLWRIDLESGARRLLVSIAALAEEAGLGRRPLFVTHASHNREGTRIVFLMRFFSPDGALYTLLYAAQPDGSGRRLLAQEKISHFDWVSETEIVVWMRRGRAALARARKSGLLAHPLARPLVGLARRARGRLKGAVLNEGYRRLCTLTGTARPFLPGLLTADGHPMRAPQGDAMVVDEYPRADGTIPLWRVDPGRGTAREIARFVHAPGTDDSDLKCDLHPRWNRAGTQVGVDTAEAGQRRFAILDLTEAF